jgi:amino-acid N-acetyltransferase
VLHGRRSDVRSGRLFAAAREGGAAQAGRVGALMTHEISARPSLQSAVQLLQQANLPTEDLTAAHCENFFFSGPSSAPSGIVGLELFGEVALLRSLVVAPGRRGTGAGASLLSHAEEQARKRGVRSLYLLTTTAEPFFARHGYARASRETAPPAIRATREFSGICPSSSAFMCRQLG